MNTELNKMLKSAPESATINVAIDPNEEDASQRLVVGFATLDNIDQTGDIVTAEASLKAFDSFRGNIRLMHLPEPVGKVIDYQPAVYFDEATGKQYNGIQVTARISKAADNAWIMCNDGTISGFSIGGRIMKTSKQYDENMGKTVNVIEEYVLTELSLVDNPANEYANITAIRKSADTVIQEGDEFTIGGDLKKVFEFKMEGGHPKVANEDINEEVVADEKKVDDEVVETETPVETEKVETEVVAEEVAPVEEVVEEEPKEESAPVVDIKSELESILNGFRDLLEETSTKLSTEFSEKMQKMNEALEAKVGEIKERQEELGEKIVAEKSLSDKLDEIQKGFNGRLEEISKSAAFKKSADNEPVVEDEGGTWKGAFTGDYR